LDEGPACMRSHNLATAPRHRFRMRSSADRFPTLLLFRREVSRAVSSECSGRVDRSGECGVRRDEYRGRSVTRTRRHDRNAWPQFLSRRSDDPSGREGPVGWVGSDPQCVLRRRARFSWGLWRLEHWRLSPPV